MRGAESLQLSHTSISYICSFTFTTTGPIFIICSFSVSVCKWMDCCLRCTEILAATVPLRPWDSAGCWQLLDLFLLPWCFCPGKCETTAHNSRLLRNLEELHLNMLFNTFGFYCLGGFFSILKSEQGIRLCP